MSVNEDIEKLLSSEKLAFLVGAGISIPPPSSLPSGRSFVDAVVSRISPTKQVADQLTVLCDAERYDRRNKGDFLRFEGLMQCLHENVDPELEVLAYIADCFHPNANHFVLARMLERRCPILTVNFDSLIELAAESDRVPLRICISEEEFRNCSLSCHDPMLFKLHGSFRRRNSGGEWRSAAESIVATLAAVGKGGGALLQDLSKRRLVIEVLQEYDLAILGYSGYDDFDICQLLASVESSRHIIWINHCPEAKQYSWEDIENSGRDCNGYFLMKRHELLYRLGTSNVAKPARQRDRIHLFDFPTGEITRMLARIQGTALPKIACEGSFDSQSFFDYWAKQHVKGECHQHFICARVLASLGRITESIRCLEEGLRAAERLEYKPWQDFFHGILGEVRKVRGDVEGTQSVWARLEPVVEDADATDERGIAFIIGPEAIDFVRHDVNIDEEAAAKRRAAERKKAHGNQLRAEGMFHLGRHQFPAALERFLQSLDAFTEAGSLSDQAEILRRLGEVYTETGLYDDAWEAITRSESLARGQGDLALVAACAAAIGALHRLSGRFQEALTSIKGVRRYTKTSATKEGLLATFLIWASRIRRWAIALKRNSVTSRVQPRPRESTKRTS